MTIVEVREQGSQSTQTQFKQSGLTVAVTSPVLSALQTASSQIKAAGQSSDSRVKALAAANVAMNAKQAVDAVKAGQGLVPTSEITPDGKPVMTEGNAADKAGGIGLSFTLGASRSQSQQTSSADTARGSNVTAGGDISIRATGGGADSDLTVRGSTVQAGGKTRLQADDQINILAAQNSSTESNSSKNSSGSIGVGINLGEQSAIRAGDGGFDVRVQGKTELTGAQITSTQAAIDAGKNRYEAQQGTSTTDLQNSASYEAKSVSVGLSAGAPKPGASLSAGLSGVGIGSDTGSASSTSTAGISGVAGDLSARTGDKEAGLKPIFDKDKVRQEVNAQVAVTSEFGKQASKAVGDYAKQQYDKAKEADDKQGMAAWEEGGKNRVALHVLVGGLTGGVQGAAGAGAASAASAHMLEGIGWQVAQFGVQPHAVVEGHDVVGDVVLCNCDTLRR